MNKKQRILLIILAIILILVITFWASDERNGNILWSKGLPHIFLLVKILQFVVPVALIYFVLEDKK